MMWNGLFSQNISTCRLGCLLKVFIFQSTNICSLLQAWVTCHINWTFVLHDITVVDKIACVCCEINSLGLLLMCRLWALESRHKGDSD